MDCQNHGEWIMTDVWETLVSDKSIVKSIERSHPLPLACTGNYPRALESLPSRPSHLRICSLPQPPHVLISQDATILCPSFLSPNLQHVKFVVAAGGGCGEKGDKKVLPFCRIRLRWGKDLWDLCNFRSNAVVPWQKVLQHKVTQGQRAWTRESLYQLQDLEQVTLPLWAPGAHL